MELTIDQLAQRVDMSARNIREWQRLGLLAPPVRRGRVGIYSDEHVARIERVRKLHAEGLPLDLIRRLSASNAGSEADIQHLADEVLEPMSAPGSASLSKSELVKRLGDGAPAALAAMGLIAEDDADTVTVNDMATLDLIQEFSAVGISPQRLAKALVEVAHHQREITRLVIDVYRDDVWEPFVASGFSTRDWGSIADGVTRAKPLVIKLLAHLLDAAFDEVAGATVLREAAEAQRALDDA
jgi:DNA-binding transcriptional MerR regulator